MQEILFFSLGACCASFAVCCADRFAKGQSLLLPGSYCDHCLHPLTWWQLIPVFGWLLQGGKCFFCHAKISILSPCLELFYACLFALLCSFYGLTLFALVLCAFQLWLLVLALEDRLTMSVSTYLLYGGAALFIAAFWRTAWLTLRQNGLELAGILLFLFGLQLKRQFGSADTIVILTLMLLNGFYFGSKVLFLAACIFLLLHWAKGSAGKAAFLPSLTAGYVCLVLLNQILRL